MTFIPQFGNQSHIDAIANMKKIDALKKELQVCQAGAKKIKRIKDDIARMERQNKLLMK